MILERLDDAPNAPRVRASCEPEYVGRMEMVGPVPRRSRWLEVAVAAGLAVAIAAMAVVAVASLVIGVLVGLYLRIVTAFSRGAGARSDRVRPPA